MHFYSSVRCSCTYHCVLYVCVLLTSHLKSVHGVWRSCTWEQLELLLHIKILAAALSASSLKVSPKNSVFLPFETRGGRNGCAAVHVMAAAAGRSITNGQKITSRWHSSQHWSLFCTRGLEFLPLAAMPWPLPPGRPPARLLALLCSKAQFLVIFT